MKISSSRKLVLAGTLALLVALLGIGWWLVTNDREDRSGVPVVASALVNSGTDGPNMTIMVEEETQTGSQEEDSPLFTPERVILNVECRMLTGRGDAKDVAVLTFFDENGTEFTVLGESGALARGRTNFRGHKIRIGHRTDGSVVFGLGDLRLNSGVFREADTDEPVKIYHNDLVIYETSKAWNFGVADDGTSFFVHEPAPGGASRLVVRDLDRDTQVEYDLGTRLSPVNDYFSGHSVGYSSDGSEVVFVSAPEDSRGMGDYYFYPVEDSNKPRRITVEGSTAALLTSSENGYFVHSPGDLEPHEVGDVWQVIRRRIDASNDEFVDLWSKRLHIRNHGGAMSISHNGKWLGLKGYEYKVLDTETGETVFSYPSAGDPEAKLARLLPVLPEGATVDDLGRQGSMRFSGDTLLVYRTYGDTEACSRKPGEPWDPVRYRECIKEQRLLGRYQEFYDIYEMDSIQLDSSPSYTVETYSESDCGPANGRWRGLLERDGELVYRSEQSANSGVLP